LKADRETAKNMPAPAREKLWIHLFQNKNCGFRQKPWPGNAACVCVQAAEATLRHQVKRKVDSDRCLQAISSYLKKNLIPANWNEQIKVQLIVA